MDRRDFLRTGVATAGAVAFGSLLLDEVAEAAEPKVIAWIRIARIQLNKPVYNSTSRAALSTGGLGHWLGTAAPGARGNCMLFGHRTASGGPLRNINAMRRGDSIKLAGLTYKVDSTLIIKSSEINKALDWNPGRKRGLQILACTRPDGRPTALTHRYIVRAYA